MIRWDEMTPKQQQEKRKQWAREKVESATRPAFLSKFPKRGSVMHSSHKSGCSPNVSTIPKIPMNELRSARQIRDSIRAAAKDKMNREYGYDLPLEEFMEHMACLTPATAGSHIQRRLLSSVGDTPVSPLHQNGDGVLLGEVKSSLLTESNRFLNSPQTRLHEPCGYTFVVYDLSAQELYVFSLSRQQMIQEAEQMKLGLGHGNKPKEYSISWAIDHKKELALHLLIDGKSIDFRRWLLQYRNTELEQKFRKWKR